jgi:hypothetical protein
MIIRSAFASKTRLSICLGSFDALRVTRVLFGQSQTGTEAETAGRQPQLDPGSQSETLKQPTRVEAIAGVRGLLANEIPV